MAPQRTLWLSLSSWSCVVLVSWVCKYVGLPRGLQLTRVRKAGFLDVATGMTVIVKHDYLTGEQHEKDW